MSDPCKKTDTEIGSHIMHCFNVESHVTGETKKLLRKRNKQAGKIVAKIYRDRQIPDALPQGIVIQITINAGGGGGP